MAGASRKVPDGTGGFGIAPDDDLVIPTLGSTPGRRDPTGRTDSGTLPAVPTVSRLCTLCGSRFPMTFKVCPHDAQPLVDAAEEADGDPLLGAVLAESYEIVRMIGEGGMGRVYEARHTRLRSKRFAVKILLDEYARNTDLIARFQREAEAAGSLSHPNVVGVYDVHRTPDGRPYIVAELLEGEELGDLLDRVKKIEVARAVRLMRQVCRALEAAHARGIVHRDMKPENVFLVGDAYDPTVKVLDFGISKLNDGNGDALTRTGMVIGTPAYMSPEQACGEKVDHRADIYAVGAILYRALTGKKPFDGKDPTGTLTAVMTMDPPRPRQLEPSIPEGLELVIERAMAKRPSDRYAKITDLEADLAPFDPEGPLPALPSGPARPGERADATARTMAAPSATSEHFLRTAREARFARPLLVFFTLLGVLWLGGSLVSAATDVLRWTRGGTGLPSATESVLIGLGTALVVATPLVLWIRFLRARIWTSTARSVQLVRQMRRVLAYALGAYAFGALALHLAEIFVFAAPGGAPPRLHVSLFTFALAAGICGFMLSLLEQRKKKA